LTSQHNRITRVQLGELVRLAARAGTDLDLDALLFSKDVAEKAIQAYAAGDCALAFELIAEERRTALVLTRRATSRWLKVEELVDLASQGISLSRIQMRGATTSL
jgi:hypothetical protein